MEPTRGQQDRTFASLIRYICVRRGHLATTSEYTLTIHNGEWAFCHDPGERPNHKWVATDGLTLEQLRRSTLAHELSVP